MTDCYAIIDTYGYVLQLTDTCKKCALINIGIIKLLSSSNQSINESINQLLILINHTH